MYFHFSNMLRYILIIGLFASCATPSRLHRDMDKLPEAAAKECATRYPIKETIDTIEVKDTELLEAYEREYAGMYAMIDSLINAKCDTVYRDKIIEIIKKIPGKPEIKHIIKTQESTARLDTLRLSYLRRESILIKENADYSAELNKYKAKVMKKNQWILWLIIVVILQSGYIFRKQILKMII